MAKQRAIGLFVLFMLTGTVLAWKCFHTAELASTELKLKQSNAKPPTAQVTFEEDYALARRKSCGEFEPLISTTICDVLRAPELFADKCIRVTNNSSLYWSLCVETQS